MIFSWFLFWCTLKSNIPKMAIFKRSPLFPNHHFGYPAVSFWKCNHNPKRSIWLSTLFNQTTAKPTQGRWWCGRRDGASTGPQREVISTDWGLKFGSMRGNVTRWWFRINVSIFTPITGEMIQFDKHIFQMGGNLIRRLLWLNFKNPNLATYGNLQKIFGSWWEKTWAMKKKTTAVV